MFRHVVMLRWADHVDDAQERVIGDALTELASGFDVIRSIVHGPDLDAVDGNFDYVIVADFDSLDDWVSYRDHRDHVDYMDVHIRPNIIDRAAVQYAT